MASNLMWLNTHQALKDYIAVLTCIKCNQLLTNPQVFLNCGHYACAECIGAITECMKCKTPGGVSNIQYDNNINDLIVNLKTIANTVQFVMPKSNLVYESSSSSLTVNSQSNTNVKKEISRRIGIYKSHDETQSSSMNESITTKMSSKGKHAENVPKNINKKNKKGETPLHIACRSNHTDRAKLLLDNGANPNTKDNAGWTPLQEAASFGYYEICEILLEGGATTNIHGYNSRTALHEAVCIDDCDIASLLLNHGANKEVFDNTGKRPRDYCQSKAMRNLFKSLQESKENQTETSCLSEKLLDSDKSFIFPINETKIVLYGSNLKSENRKLLIKLGTEKKLKIANKLSSSVTHVIIDIDATNGVKLTLDILLTILQGKRLLMSECLSILMDSENITVSDLNLFDVDSPRLNDSFTRARINVEKMEPKLFNNCYFHFAMKPHDNIFYDKMSLTKEDLVKLVYAGGGSILAREPKPEDIDGSLSPFHAAHDSKHALHKCTHYIIYIPNQFKARSTQIIYNMPVLKSLPLMWFIESIINYKLLDPSHLGLSSIS